MLKALWIVYGHGTRTPAGPYDLGNGVAYCFIWLIHMFHVVS